MSKRCDRPNRRHGRRRQGAQAVVEMAMVMPIMLALVFNFLGVMVLVEGQNRLQAAVNMAAQASITAPLDDAPHSCEYAAQAFWSTVYADPSYSGGFAGCAAPGSGAFTVPTAGAPAGSAMTVTTPLRCVAVGPTYDYYNAAGYTPATLPAAGQVAVQCTASVKFNFNNTPLAFAVKWNPTYTASSEAIPTTVRQCNLSLATC